jgi:hypothetical protein
LGPEGGRPDRPTQTVRHTCTCSGNVGIVKILRYTWSEINVREHRRCNKEKDNPETYELAMLSAQDTGKKLTQKEIQKKMYMICDHCGGVNIFRLFGVQLY